MSEPREPPYPADTLAKGWRFELDMDKVKRSDTWLRAKSGEMRGALLLLWSESWLQAPCGSLPDDDELVAILIDMPQAKFARLRGVLMRGWWLATDGRLYHDTIADRVLEMLSAKTKERERKAAYRQRMEAERAAQAAGNPPVSHGTGSGQPPDGRVSDGTGTGTGTSTEKKEDPPKPPRKRRGGAADAATVGVEQLIAEGVGEQHAKDWLTVRKAKTLPLTPTAWDDVKAEAAKAGLTLDQAVHAAVIKSWGGFKASWVAKEAAAEAAGGAAAGQWWESKTGLTERGQQLGIEVPADEHPNVWLRFKAQVWVAAGDGPWWDKTSVAYPIALRMRDEGGAVAAAALGGLRRVA